MLHSNCHKYFHALTSRCYYEVVCFAHTVTRCVYQLANSGHCIAVTVRYTINGRLA